MSEVVISDPAYSSAGRPSGRLLEVDDLRVEFRTRDGVAKVINGVTYHVDAGETLAVLGESGSGKSVTALSLMQLVSTVNGLIRGEAHPPFARQAFVSAALEVGILAAD